MAVGSNLIFFILSALHVFSYFLSNVDTSASSIISIRDLSLPFVKSDLPLRLANTEAGYNDKFKFSLAVSVHSPDIHLNLGFNN